MELGSEYDLDVTELYPKKYAVDRYLSAFHRCFFSSGRAAIRAWARCFLGDGEILLPEYICDTVIRCFPLSRIRFYHVHTDMTADAEDVIRCISSGTSAIFWVNYYGTLQPENARKSVRQAADAHGIRILEDMTQSFLTATGTIGDDFVASLRKWFPIPMGGVLYSRHVLPKEIYGYPPSTQNEKVVPSILKHISLFGGGQTLQFRISREVRRAGASARRGRDHHTYVAPHDVHAFLFQSQGDFREKEREFFLSGTGTPRTLRTISGCCLFQGRLSVCVSVARSERTRCVSLLSDRPSRLLRSPLAA
ncbi:DegT/DnrJ/EryC1/StrS family aminotransferase [Selenomonas sp.]|uniref:DegT/DnrJ/EryC1/StrS family aminotransferase n=1 Tax=Selenomonas sp. TaxID=2053611 RepID=UPI002A82CBD5|nr:DegT/DnrJ/EryC1/StrS family aminotransferase [Selenomonas sp.]MDY4415591.1 DegT/DnrJ/EryC1/StrS family aminotransferase [Selenomonas sp.]